MYRDLPTDMMMKSISLRFAALCLSALPFAALAQSGGSSAYIEDRLGQMSRSIADLQGRLDQLRRQNQQLQQSLDKMRTSYEARLDRLEKGGSTAAAKPATPTPHVGQPKR